MDSLERVKALEYFHMNHGDQRLFFRFEIIVNILVSSLRFIKIHMLWVYGHYKCFNSFSAGTGFIRQNV